MSGYSVSELTKCFIDDSESSVSPSEYKKWIKSFLEIEKPGYIGIFNLKKEETLVYSKNVKLDFGIKEDPTYYDILKGISTKDIGKILESDREIVRFVFEERSGLTPLRNEIRLRFTAILKGDEPRSLIRNASLIKVDEKNQPHLLLVSVSDVTNFLGFQNFPSLTIKSNYELSDKLKKLVIRLNNILSPEVKLTKREVEVFNLIKNGLTSKEIATALYISEKTVSKHRQNLIKKYKVKSTTALINII